MRSISDIVRRIIALREQGTQMTLLAACPNSDAVLEAAVKAAALNNAPMLFAAARSGRQMDSVVDWILFQSTNEHHFCN